MTLLVCKWQLQKVLEICVYLSRRGLPFFIINLLPKKTGQKQLLVTFPCQWWHYLTILQTNVTDVRLLLLSRGSPLESEIQVLVRNSRHYQMGGGWKFMKILERDRGLISPGCQGVWACRIPDHPTVFIESGAAVTIIQMSPLERNCSASNSWWEPDFTSPGTRMCEIEHFN